MDRLRAANLYLWLMATSLLLALLPVVWPGLDVAVAAFFTDAHAPIQPGSWWWVVEVNEYTPNVFRGLTLASALAWLVCTVVPRWRRWTLSLAFVGLSIGLGPGLATWAVKEHHLRARPLDVVQFGGQREYSAPLVQAQQCNDNCAFVSGHAGCGMVLAAFMLLWPRRRRWWLAAGIIGGLGIGFARVGVSAHWLSDVLWAYPVTLTTAWLVWQGLAAVYRPLVDQGQAHV